jgi:DNA polymerase III subunit delta'
VSSRVIGHNEQRRRLAIAWKAGRLAHAYLFVGPQGIGKRAFATRFSQALLCHQPNVDDLEPCGVCPSCRVFEGGNHPDFQEVEIEKDRHEFRIEVVRDLLPKLALKPAVGSERVTIIDDADRFNDEAANALLKTLEEPPPRSRLLLMAAGVEGMLPTIRSRCQTIKFGPLSVEETAQVLLQSGVVDSSEVAQMLAESAGGSVSAAKELLDEEWMALKPQIEDRLSKPTIDLVYFAKAINKYCEEKAKDAAEKRRRALQVVRTALRLFEEALQASIAGTAAKTEAVAVAARLPEETLIDLIERSLEADQQIKRYLHLPTTIDCWIDDLAQIAAGTFSPTARY